MTSILELAHGGSGRLEPVPGIWWKGAGFLWETGVLLMAHDAKFATVDVLLDLRGSPQIREGTVGVLSAEGVSTLAWQELERRGAASPWLVMGGAIDLLANGQLSIELVCAPQARLSLIARSAMLHIVEVPGMPNEEVNHDLGGPAIRTVTPTWDSEGILLVSYKVTVGRESAAD